MCCLRHKSQDSHAKAYTTYLDVRQLETSKKTLGNLPAFKLLEATDSLRDTVFPTAMRLAGNIHWHPSVQFLFAIRMTGHRTLIELVDSPTTLPFSQFRPRKTLLYWYCSGDHLNLLHSFHSPFYAPHRGCSPPNHGPS